jgi:hypothetical protein
MRLKILEALKNKHMMDDTRDLIDNLWLTKKSVFCAGVLIIG